MLLLGDVVTVAKYRHGRCSALNEALLAFTAPTYQSLACEKKDQSHLRRLINKDHSSQVNSIKIKLNSRVAKCEFDTEQLSSKFEINRQSLDKIPLNNSRVAKREFYTELAKQKNPIYTLFYR